MANSRAVPLTVRRARQLRHEQTDAERALWHRLRARGLSGFRFRRQFPIGGFITDFCCRECHLVIELDGGQHGRQEGLERDAHRTGQIEHRGYRVLRFWDREVLTNIEGVLEAIFRRCQDERNRIRDLSPALSLDKERDTST